MQNLFGVNCGKTRPSQAKDDVTWTLATEHWTLTLLLTFEYLLLTTWGYCYWPIRLLKTSEIFRVMHANTCVPALDLCIRVLDIELMLLGMIKLIAIFLFCDLIRVWSSIVLVLFWFWLFFSFLYWGGCDMLHDFLLCQWFPLCSVVVKNHVLRNQVVIHSSVSCFHELYTSACDTVMWHWPEDSLFNTVNWP